MYVDDLLVTGSNMQLIKETKTALHTVFKIKDLGELRFFLGIEFARSKTDILMHQRKYALELIYELGLGAAKPATTPLEVNIKLTTKEVDDYVSKDKSNDPLVDKAAYQKIIGKLLYLAITRPDISFSVQTLSQSLHQPKQSYLEATLRIVRYIKSQPGQGTILSSSSQEILSAHCDVDWVACPNTRKSVIGFLVKLGDSLISWKSKKQNTISRSSAKAEYRSHASTIAELSWIVGLFKELGVEVHLPIQVNIDSKAAIQIVANPVFHERTKHT